MSDGHSQSEKTIKSLEPGEWLWRDGIGYRRNNSGNGGSWYIKYRAPVQGDYGPEITPPMRQVKERLPNCKNRTQAAKVLAARKAAVFQGTYQQKRKAAPTSLETYLPRFLAAKRHLKTVKKYEQQLRQYLIPFFKKKPLEAITQSDCQEYYNHRLDSDAAISTVNGEIACLKSLLSEATREGIISANPAKAVRLLNPNNVRDRILSSEETARLFIAADEQPDFVRPLFHTLFHTGMRLGEALALEWADIQHEHNRIVIRQSKSGEGRKAPLRDVLADELIRWRPYACGSRWVFPSRYDKEKPMQSIRKGWLRLCAAAGIDDLRPHDLRHNFTSMLQANGVSDSVIMSITGHKTHVMLHRYSHSRDAQKRDAVAGLPLPPRHATEKILKISGC